MSVDAMLARLLEQVEALGVLNDTYIVYTSDVRAVCTAACPFPCSSHHLTRNHHDSTATTWVSSG